MLGDQQRSDYLWGFGSHFESESVPDSLPIGQNSPRECPLGLYAEQLSGTAFTVPRVHNQRTWLYRVLPSVTHRPFEPYSKGVDLRGEMSVVTPNQLRWDPFPVRAELDFLDSLRMVGSAGAPEVRHGVAVYVYGFARDMNGRAFYDSDGDFLIGTLEVRTEFGVLRVSPLEICVIPRGIRYSVSLYHGKDVTGEPTAAAQGRGYILEIQGGHFELPNLGPIGANGLANPQDFAYPRASTLMEQNKQWTIITKFCNEYFQAQQDHSPFDVVAWRGNYAPFKYDLRRFNTINTVSFDHPDPSIFTVLTCPLGNEQPGTSLADFVIFPPRYACGDHTFRPPYYHRNCMSEFMGLIQGVYEAKSGDGFSEGGASLHSCMTPHGPDKDAYEKAIKQADGAVRVGEGTMAFMFETCMLLRVREWAQRASQPNYWQAWSNLPTNYSSKKSHTARH